jgi:site-specific DNA recombinase
MVMTNKAIGYVRVSSIGQVDGEGLGVQKDKIEAWCRYQQVELLGIEMDAGISGAEIDNRPGFIEALRKALAFGEGVVLVVTKLDRLGRDALDIQEVIALLLDSSIRIVSIGDGIDSASGMGSAILKVLTNILATFAELEKETIRTRLVDGRRRADREGRRYASEPRYGRTVGPDGRVLVAAPEEQVVIEMARHLHQSGLSYRTICQRLHETGHRPRRASTWSATVVRRLVKGSRGPAVAKGRMNPRRAEGLMKRIVEASNRATTLAVVQPSQGVDQVASMGLKPTS